jgi:hypothetical protein
MEWEAQARGLFGLPGAPFTGYGGRLYAAVSGGAASARDCGILRYRRAISLRPIQGWFGRCLGRSASRAAGLCQTADRPSKQQTRSMHERPDRMATGAARTGGSRSTTKAET